MIAIIGDDERVMIRRLIVIAVISDTGLVNIDFSWNIEACKYIVVDWLILCHNR